MIVPSVGACSQTVFVKSKTLVSAAITLQTIAVGKVGADESPAPTIPLVNTGLTHPSVIYVDGGWNGYSYWMAITPAWGSIPNNHYENPHIFCSIDGENWIEPIGGTNPIDLPPALPAYDYLSDTHIVIDGGYLYCFYRGNGPSYGGRGLFYKRSIDGVNWSARTLVESTDSLTSVDDDNLLASPVFFDIGDSYAEYVVLRSSETGLAIPPQKNQENEFIFRKTSESLDSGYGEYSTAQVVNLFSAPWGEGFDPWHLDIRKAGNTYLMLINVDGQTIWLGYSSDGINFKVVPTALFSSHTYRSAIVPIVITDEEITCKVYRADTVTGSIDLYDVVITIV